MEEDLGILVDNELKFEHHINRIVKKANSSLGTIKRTFTSLNSSTFTLLYKSLVRSQLEYCQEVWSPTRKGLIDKLEKVQRRATKMVRNLRDLPYEERLQTLKLPSLQHRRLRGDIIVMFKINHGLLKTSMEVPYSNNPGLRGHQFKLEPSLFRTSSRRNFFSNRVVSEWNSLPSQVVNSKTVETFKSQLDKHWSTTKNIYTT